MYLNGDGIEGRDRRGQPVKDDHFLILFNGGDALSLDLPRRRVRRERGRSCSTRPASATPHQRSMPATTFELPYRSVVVLRQWHEEPIEVDVSPAASVASMATDA